MWVRGVFVAAAAANVLEKQAWMDTLTGTTLADNLAINALQSRYDSPDGMAFDHVSRKVYIADTGNDEIKELDVKANSVIPLYMPGLEKPRGLALGMPLMIFTGPYKYLYLVAGGNYKVRVIDLDMGWQSVQDVMGSGAQVLLSLVTGFHPNRTPTHPAMYSTPSRTPPPGGADPSSE